jgi:hypothetical protein
MEASSLKCQGSARPFTHLACSRGISRQRKWRTAGRTKKSPAFPRGSFNPLVHQPRTILLLGGLASSRQTRTLRAVAGVVRHAQRPRRHPHPGWSEDHGDAASGGGG